MVKLRMLPFHGNMQYFMHTTSQPISLAYHAACLEFYISFGIILSERLAYNKPMYVRTSNATNWKMKLMMLPDTIHATIQSFYIPTYTQSMWAHCCPLLFINNNNLLTDNRPVCTCYLEVQCLRTL